MPNETSSADTPSARERLNTLERLLQGIESLVAGSHLFRSLDDAGRRRLIASGRLVLFPAGSVIIREGEPGDSFYVIDQGVVEVSTRSEGAGEVSLTTLQRGAFFGEVSVLTGSARTATVTALTAVSAVAFDKSTVDELLANNPKARRLLDAVIEGRARDAAEKIAKATLNPPPKGSDEP